jgi:endo-1,4-beta-xylanase
MLLMISKVLYCTVACAGILIAQERGEEILLWANGAPGAVNAPDKFDASSNPKLPKRFTVVNHPSIFAFLAPREAAGRVAVIVAPGGGHSNLVIDKEGWVIADWLNKNGIAAFVLKYRLAKAPGSHYTVEGDALADAARAMRLVRSRASEWNIDPRKIGFMGFSAGGAVAALIETRFDAGNPDAADSVDRVSSRPDFAVDVYPGFPDGMINVPKDAPQTFLVCADDDPTHVVTTVKLYLDLQKQGLSSEMHIYASGKHGFAMNNTSLPVATWPDRLHDWMIDREILTR